MATAQSTTDDDRLSLQLSESQQQTYVTLMTMGFGTNESQTTAQIFGSNIAGAIDCIISGDIHNIGNNAPSQLPFQAPEEHKSTEDNIRPFRTTDASYLLAFGYFRESDGMNEYLFPLDVSHLIMSYANMYFIRTNCNIDNDNSSQPLSLLTAQDNVSLRDMAIKLQKNMYNQDHYITDDHVDSLIVRFHLRFYQLKSIYPCNNRNVKISMEHVEENMYGFKCESYQWVEIPNDYLDVSINDFDQMLCSTLDDEKSHQHTFELGFTLFNDAGIHPKEVLLEIDAPLKHGEYAICAELHWDGTLNDDYQQISKREFYENEPDENQIFVVKRQECEHYTIQCKRNECDANLMSSLATLLREDKLASALESFTLTMKDFAFHSYSNECRASLFDEERIDNWINNLQVGDIVDVKDDQDKWYESVIRSIEHRGNRKVLYLHYIGWSKKWDEAIYADVDRIAKRNTETKGPHRHKKYQEVEASHRSMMGYDASALYPLSYSDHWTPNK